MRHLRDMPRRAKNGFREGEEKTAMLDVLRISVCLVSSFTLLMQLLLLMKICFDLDCRRDS